MVKTRAKKGPARVAVEDGLRVRVRAYDVVRRAVDEGVAYGVRRAFKHSATPPTEAEIDAIRQAVEDAVMNELCEVIDFPEPA